MKTYKFNDYEIHFKKSKYNYNNSLAVMAYYFEEAGTFGPYEAPYAVFTVNIDDSDNLPPDEAFIDTNNFSYTKPDVIDWLVKNNIATPTGQYGRSGYCTYPAVKFNKEFLDETEELE